MQKEIVSKLTKNFEDYVHREEGIEFWYARDLQILLGYVEWRKFLGVIDRAKESCKNSNQKVTDHFVGAAKTIHLPKVAIREPDDIKLGSYLGTNCPNV